MDCGCGQITSEVGEYVDETTAEETIPAPVYETDELDPLTDSSAEVAVDGPVDPYVAESSIEDPYVDETTLAAASEATPVPTPTPDGQGLTIMPDVSSATDDGASLVIMPPSAEPSIDGTSLVINPPATEPANDGASLVINPPGTEPVSDGASIVIHPEMDPLTKAMLLAHQLGDSSAIDQLSQVRESQDRAIDAIVRPEVPPH